jgi:hypothetical protein
MTRYLVWFVGAGSRYAVQAETRKEAIAIFAESQGVKVSGYIQARILNHFDDTAGLQRVNF